MEEVVGRADRMPQKLFFQITSVTQFGDARLPRSPPIVTAVRRATAPQLLL